MMYGDCTTFLTRDHATDAHINWAADKPDNQQKCGLYHKSGGINCPSIQNTSFHGFATHKQSTSSHTSAHQDVGYLKQQKEWLQLQTRRDQLPERTHNRKNVALSLKEDKLEDIATSGTRENLTPPRKSRYPALLQKVKNKLRGLLEFCLRFQSYSFCYSGAHAKFQNRNLPPSGL
jgi:hypothetical protein